MTTTKGSDTMERMDSLKDSVRDFVHSGQDKVGDLKDKAMEVKDKAFDAGAQALGRTRDLIQAAPDRLGRDRVRRRLPRDARRTLPVAPAHGRAHGHFGAVIRPHAIARTRVSRRIGLHVVRLLVDDERGAAAAEHPVRAGLRLMLGSVTRSSRCSWRPR